VARAFPKQIDGFNRLAAAVPDYDDLPFDRAEDSARAWVGQFVDDPLLIEMIFCPLMYYGSAREDDMDLAQFFIMFRSIFCEGFSRPADGIRPILKMLVRRYRELGGELRLRAGVRRIVHEGDQAVGVELDGGETLSTANVLSSAGFVETMRLCGRAAPNVEQDAGRLGFVETCSLLDCPATNVGIDRTIVFFSADEKFAWRRPQDLVSPRSGVLCMPGNFQFDEPLDDPAVRVTALADYDGWAALPEDRYRAAKQQWYDVLTATATRYLGDFRPHVVDSDMFTPTTVVRYTGHVNGAIYGAARKRYDGSTFLNNVSLCGTDQGYVGIIGALVGGITTANLRVLQSAKT
jgi:phytoene dehydrogenase-like protein